MGTSTSTSTLEIVDRTKNNIESIQSPSAPFLVGKEIDNTGDVRSNDNTYSHNDDDNDDLSQQQQQRENDEKKKEKEERNQNMSEVVSKKSEEIDNDDEHSKKEIMAFENNSKSLTYFEPKLEEKENNDSVLVEDGDDHEHDNDNDNDNDDAKKLSTTIPLDLESLQKTTTTTRAKIEMNKKEKYEEDEVDCNKAEDEANANANVYNSDNDANDDVNEEELDLANTKTRKTSAALPINDDDEGDKIINSMNNYSNNKEGDQKRETIYVGKNENVNENKYENKDVDVTNNENDDLRAVIYQNITGNTLTYEPLVNLRKLGYTVKQLERIQAEILSVIVLDKRKNPKMGGVPIQWKIKNSRAPSEITIVNSIEEASKIVHRMNDEEQKERNSIIERRRPQERRESSNRRRS